MKTCQQFKNQVGCGYCAFETVCPIHNPKVNKAKKGCKGFLHHERTDKK